MWRTPTRSYRLADYRRTSAKYPYYALVPQGRFLPFMVERGRAVPRLPRRDGRAGLRAAARPRRRGAGRVIGVEYTRGGERHRLRADLVVGADGRNSKVRTLSTITATELGAHLDICWYEVPRRDGDPPLSGLELIAEPGATLAVLGQAASWQLGYTIPAGTFPELRAGGIGPVVGALRRRLPWLGDRLDGLTEVNQLSLLPVRITRTDRWSEPGLLLIGDAAHVISPVGGNGVNFAVLDAVEAANRLVGPAAGRPGRARGGGRRDGRGRGGPPPAGRPRPGAAEADRARRGAAAAHPGAAAPARPALVRLGARSRPVGRRAGASGRWPHHRSTTGSCTRPPDPVPGLIAAG